MSSATSKNLRQDEHAKHPPSADALSVFAALANRDRLTDCLAAAGCLTTARLVCRRLRDLVDGGVKSIKLSITHDKAETLAREQTLAALLRRWDRCQDLTVKLKGNWGDNAALFQTTPLWLFAGVSSNALSRIQAFTLSTCDLRRKKPDYIALVSALAARMPSLRRLDLYGCSHGWQHREGIGAHLFTLFYTALAVTCPRLETLSLPWGAHLPGVEALAGSLMRLRVGAGDDVHKSKWALSPAALQSISRLEHLREMILEGLAFKDPDDDYHPITDDEDEGEDNEDTEDNDDEEDSAEANPAGSKLLRLLDSLPPSVELLELAVPRFWLNPGWFVVMGIRFDFKHGWLQSVDVRDGVSFRTELRALTHALLRCRAAGTGVGAGGGVGPQQQRPSLQVSGIHICKPDKADAAYVAELGMLQDRFSFGALDNVSFQSLHDTYTDALARCVGRIVIVFGLPQELQEWDLVGRHTLRLRRADAAALCGAHTVTAAPALDVAQGSAAGAAVTDAAAVAGAVVSLADAAPTPHGGGSSQTGGSTAIVVLETAGVEDVLQMAAERLWADTHTLQAAGGPMPGAASTTWVNKAVLLHRPCTEATEWGHIKEAVNAELQRRSDFMWPQYQWVLAGPRFALAFCYPNGAALELMAFASSPDSPFMRGGIRATLLQAGAAKSALRQVLLELWHGSTSSRCIMSQERRLERRLERLVELLVGAGRWC